jgi:hypothetical protein
MADDFIEFRVVIPVAPDAKNGGIGTQLDFLLEHGWNPPEHLLREARA